MSIDGVSGLAVGAMVGTVPSATAGSGAQKSFDAWMTSQINHVNAQVHTADTQVQALAVGEADNLHQVMQSLEKAKLSFELMVQVRNRVLEAYQDIMRMQI